MSMGYLLSMRSGHNGSNRGGDNTGYWDSDNGGSRNEYTGWGQMMDEPSMNMNGGGPYDAFRDRNGRRHYDNGRFAPMQNTYNVNVPYIKREMDYHDYNRGYGEYNAYDSHGNMEMRGRGSGRGGSWGGNGRSYSYGRGVYNHMGGDMEEQDGHQMGFAAYGEDRMDKQTAEEWVQDMQNEDGSQGPHWTMEQSRQIAKQHGIKCDPAEFFAALNMMYSDYCKVAKEFNVNSSGFFAKLAKAFLDDKDAGKGKLMKYYECVVR